MPKADEFDEVVVVVVVDEGVLADDVLDTDELDDKVLFILGALEVGVLPIDSTVDVSCNADSVVGADKPLMLMLLEEDCSDSEELEVFEAAISVKDINAKSSSKDVEADAVADAEGGSRFDVESEVDDDIDDDTEAEDDVEMCFPADKELMEVAVDGALSEVGVSSDNKDIMSLIVSSTLRLVDAAALVDFDISAKLVAVLFDSGDVVDGLLVDVSGTSVIMEMLEDKRLLVFELSTLETVSADSGTNARGAVDVGVVVVVTAVVVVEDIDDSDEVVVVVVELLEELVGVFIKDVEEVRPNL
ncbi:hypothetical protein GGI07_004124 [Coemansia sp. Benny D115]|nr:hypothetical protein GGI07_004124 [Coemansia sp. Benny D115]